MTEPTGYTALDLIGFTDQGTYDSTTAYVQNDLVHYDDSIWRCLIDDTTGQTPAEGNYWTIFVEATGGSGASSADAVTYDNTSSGLTAENVQDAIDEVVTDLSDKVDWESNGILGAKNLLENTASTTTTNGVTFTVNDDGSVTVSGTATATTKFYLNSAIALDVGTELIISGCPSDGSASTYSFRLEDSSSTVLATDNGSEANVTTTTSTVKALIRIYNGYEITDSLTFYPMIRLATDTDSTYQPYAKTNLELTEEIDTKADSTIIGDAYDSSTTYAAGDYFIYDNVLYYVDVACTGITPPNTSYYTATTVTSQISNLAWDGDYFDTSNHYKGFYMSDGRMVYVCLSLANNWVSQSELSGYTLPSGYRPTYKMYFDGQYYSGSSWTNTRISITNGGVISVPDVSSYTYVRANIIFPMTLPS